MGESGNKELGERFLSFPAVEGRPLHWALPDFSLNVCLFLFPVFVLRPSFLRHAGFPGPLLFKPTLPTQVLWRLKGPVSALPGMGSPSLV